MNKLLFIFIAMLAMVGISNAQLPITKCGAPGCSLDGFFCGPGQADCANDPNNCGAVGHVCGDCSDCGDGVCHQAKCSIPAPTAARGERKHTIVLPTRLRPLQPIKL